MRSATTTTTAAKRSAHRNAPALPAGSDTRDELQRAALALAEALGWRVEVEARDGTRARLRQGHPAAALVITLAPAAGDGLAELYP